MVTAREQNWTRMYSGVKCTWYIWKDSLHDSVGEYRIRIAIWNYPVVRDLTVEVVCIIKLSSSSVFRILQHSKASCARIHLRNMQQLAI